MRLNFSWSRFAVTAAVLALPLKAGGCTGNTACFTFTQAAYDKASGSCPASAKALTRFSDSGCGSLGPIASVDGEGSFDGEFCCYPVTETNGFSDCIGGTGGFSSTGGSGIGGFGDTTTSTSTGSFTTSSTGGGGGMAMCFTCNDELNGLSMDPGQLCGGSAMFWSALGTCNCGSGPCTTACSASACSGMTPTDACQACMADTSAAGCGSQLADCKAN